MLVSSYDDKGYFITRTSELIKLSRQILGLVTGIVLGHAALNHNVDIMVFSRPY